MEAEGSAALTDGLASLAGPCALVACQLVEVVPLGADGAQPKRARSARGIQPCALN